MVRIHADGAAGEKAVDLTAFQTITKHAMPSEQSPSNSAATIKRIAKRYETGQIITIFEDGKELSKNSPCIQLDLNELLRKYYIR